MKKGRIWPKPSFEHFRYSRTFLEIRKVKNRVKSFDLPKVENHAYRTFWLDIQSYRFFWNVLEKRNVSKLEFYAYLYNTITFERITVDVKLF